MLTREQQTKERSDFVFYSTLAAWGLPAVGVLLLTVPSPAEFQRMMKVNQHRQALEQQKVENAFSRERYEAEVDHRLEEMAIEARRRIAIGCRPVTLSLGGQPLTEGALQPGVRSQVALNPDGSRKFADGQCIIDPLGHTGIVQGIDVIDMLPPPPEFKIQEKKNGQDAETT